MRRRLVIILAACAAALAPALSLAAPALAAAPDTCTITSSYCNILDQSVHDRWIYGTNHNEALIGDLSSDPYSAVSQGGGWYEIVNGINGLCWNEVGNLIYSDSCVGDSQELWDFKSSGTNGHLIENQAEGEHWAVLCCVSSGGSSNYIGFGNGYTDGREYWNWKS